MKGSGNHVLVVDNDCDFLTTIQHLLEDQGIDTTTTWNVKEALGLLGSQPFQVILVGHHPPELNASEILLQRGGTSSTYFVLQPTSGVSPDNRVLLSQGAKEVLCKWHYRDIIERVHKCFKAPPAAAVA